MADYNLAIKPVLFWEGGYVNDPDDQGGETYAGITRKNWPNWPGWPIVDAAKPLKKGQFVLAADPYVKIFYRPKYWEAIRGDEIADQRVATFLLDFYVNSGYHAVKAIQKVVGVRQDGLIGKQTMAAINSTTGVFEDLKRARVAFLHKAAKIKNNAKYLAGWLRRVNSFK